MKERHPCEFYIDGYVEIKTKYDNLINKIHEKIEYHKKMGDISEAQYFQELLED